MASVPETVTPANLLVGLCERLVRTVGGCACAVSRVIGDLLVQVAEDSGPRRTLQLGAGYMIPDYPVTRDVLHDRVPRAVSLEDPEPDAGEAAVLQNLGFTSVLMLPLVLDDRPWGLVELYGTTGRRFTSGDAEQATVLVADAAAALEGLRGPRRES